jgi:hypothetical protein
MTLPVSSTPAWHPAASRHSDIEHRPLRGTRAELQSRLDDFYRAHFIKEAFGERELQELSMPHLIAVQQEYVEAPLRIMFIGQETTNWVGTLGTYVSDSSSLQRVKDAYSRLAQKTKHSSALMRYRVRLSQEFLGGKPAAIGWANLLRMDWDQGRGGRDIGGKRNHTWAALHFDAADSTFHELSAKTLAFELAVLQPDVIIFGSGHGYDACLKRAVGEYVTDTANFLPKRVWPFEALGAYCIRLPHPNMRPREKGGQGAPHFYDVGFQLLRDRLDSRKGTAGSY